MGGYCQDETCPYSDWPQRVELEDLYEMSTSQVESKYKVSKRKPETLDEMKKVKNLQVGDIVRLPNLKPRAGEEWAGGPDFTVLELQPSASGKTVYVELDVAGGYQWKNDKKVEVVGFDESLQETSLKITKAEVIDDGECVMIETDSGDVFFFAAHKLEGLAEIAEDMD